MNRWGRQNVMKRSIDALAASMRCMKIHAAVAAAVARRTLYRARRIFVQGTVF